MVWRGWGVRREVIASENPEQNLKSEIQTPKSEI
jgi:hypothetical protein